MRSLKKLRQKFSGKSITKAQANHLKGGDDKRKGHSGGGQGTPPGGESNPGGGGGVTPGVGP